MQTRFGSSCPPVKKYDAKVVGADQKTDLAVIKVEAGEQLTTVKVGDSDSMRQGDWVLAVGSPFGLEQTVTAGIISATGRKFGMRAPWQQFLQTDAAINQGNSGGPLVNMAGEVIGVNTAIFTNATIGGNLGIGFALPSNLATNVYNQLIQYGKVKRGAIGIKMQGEVTPQTLKALGATDGKGVIVEEPNPKDGPAAKAGLKQGDVIIEVNGQKVNDNSDMHRILSTILPGTTITIKYIRNEKIRTTKLTTVDRDEIISEAGTGAVVKEDDTEAIRLGITPQNLTPRQTSELNLSEDEGGIIVRSVDPDSIADQAGIRRYDVILEINKKPTRTVQEFKGITSQLESGMDILFLVKRWEPQRRRGHNALLGDYGALEIILGYQRPSVPFAKSLDTRRFAMKPFLVWPVRTVGRKLHLQNKS